MTLALVWRSVKARNAARHFREPLIPVTWLTLAEREYEAESFRAVSPRPGGQSALMPCAYGLRQIAGTNSGKRRCLKMEPLFKRSLVRSNG
jgi:hypothetical protein